MKIFLDVGAHIGERLRSVLDSKYGFDRIYRQARKAAAKISFLRSTWHLGRALVEFARDPWRTPSYFERFFVAPDPWECDTDEGRENYIVVESVLERVRQGKFRHALEVGCAEGVFTEMLAQRCESLVAVDFAPTALQRARQRLPHGHIRFDLFDLRQDPISGTFDLIAAMDVLDYIFRPTVLRKIRDKLVAALKPGGYLLFVSPRQDVLFETTWWGRLLQRGGENVRDYIGSHSSLSLVSADTTETHVFALFQKETG